MSHLVRFTHGTGTIRASLLTDEQLRPLAVSSMSDLLRHTVAEIRELAEAAGEPVSTTGTRLLPPLDGRMKVWAAGVTYRRSEEARREENATAAELIVEHGVRSLTLARVEERAGYSRGIVTHHFGTKQALVERLARATQTGFVPDLDDVPPRLVVLDHVQVISPNSRLA